MRKTIKIWWFFTRYLHKKLIVMLSLELIGKIKRHKGKEKLMVNDYMLHKGIRQDHITKIILRY